MKSVAIALGGGGARGIAHIVALEALDEIGVRPVAIAGTSIGAFVGAGYAAGMSARQVRRYTLSLAHNRAEMFRRVVQSRAGRLANLFTSGFSNTTVLDAEKFCGLFLPPDIPDDFSELQIPLIVIATDLYARREVVFTKGPLRQAVAASIALPGLAKPVVVDGRVLIDGGATNPLPFEHLRGKADVVIAIDISGEPTDEPRAVPSPWEALVTTVLVMGHAIITEKLKHGAPDLIVRPNVGTFRTLDFVQASAILRASEPIKDMIKEKVGALIGK
jgi:NTE family protein